MAGKAATKAAKAGTSQAAAQEANGEKKKNGVFLNYVSEKLVHKYQGKDGKTYAQIGIADDQSLSGFGNVLVHESHLYPSTKRNGELVPGFVNVGIGYQPDAAVNYTIKVADTGDSAKDFDRVEMTAAELKQKYENDHKAYKARIRDVDNTKSVETERQASVEEAEPEMG